MKNIIFFVLFLLASCAKDSPPGYATRANDKTEPTTDEKQVDDNSPKIEIPSNAALAEFSCEERKEYTDNAGTKHDDKITLNSGTSHSWKSDGISYSFEQNENGKIRTLTKTKTKKTSPTDYNLTIETTLFELDGDTWNENTSITLRTQRTIDGGIIQVISNKVNGVDQPFPWNIEEVEVSDKIYKEIHRHSQPATFNKDGITYTSVESTCTYTEK